MADFVAGDPITVRVHPKFTVVYRGGGYAPFVVNGKSASWYSTTELLGNEQHYLRPAVAGALEEMRSGDIVGFVRGEVEGKLAMIMIRKEHYALMASEMERFSAWQAGIARNVEASQAAERAYDLAYNEGGEGYNPHRHGDRPTYRTTSRRERDYPEGA